MYVTLSAETYYCMKSCSIILGTPHDTWRIRAALSIFCISTSIQLQYRVAMVEWARASFCGACRYDYCTVVWCVFAESSYRGISSAESFPNIFSQKQPVHIFQSVRACNSSSRGRASAGFPSRRVQKRLLYRSFFIAILHSLYTEQSLLRVTFLRYLPKKSRHTY